MLSSFVMYALLAFLCDIQLSIDSFTFNFVLMFPHFVLFATIDELFPFEIPSNSSVNNLDKVFQVTTKKNPTKYLHSYASVYQIININHQFFSCAFQRHTHTHHEHVHVSCARNIEWHLHQLEQATSHHSNDKTMCNANSIAVNANIMIY